MSTTQYHSDLDIVSDVWKLATERQEFHYRLWEKVVAKSGNIGNRHAKASEQWRKLAEAADVVLQARYTKVRT